MAFNKLRNWSLLFWLFYFLLSNNEKIHAQDYDLQIVPSQIVTPTDGAEFCNNDNPPLRFQVNNLDSSPGSGLYTDIDINAHNLLATLTLTGVNTGVVTRSFNTKGSGSQNPGSTTIATTTYAFFDWPESLSIPNIGTTTITIEIKVSRFCQINNCEFKNSAGWISEPPCIFTVFCGADLLYQAILHYC